MLNITPNTSKNTTPNTTIKSLKSILKKHSSNAEQTKRVTFKIPRNGNRRKRKRKTKPSKTIKILYTNANGITGKTASLRSALEEQNTTIALIAETKLDAIPPNIPNYKWIPRNRKDRQGGGVAILYSTDIKNNISEVENIENDNLEVQWAQIKSGNQKTFLGIYYGPQEKTNREDVQREYDALKSQINSLKQKGKVILAGDFNAKLNIKIPEKNINQKISRNGELLKELLEDTETIPINTDPTICEWTRENRKNPNEKSVIDYIIVTPETQANIVETRVDKAGTHRLKGKKETDHNTILLELDNTIHPATQPRITWKKATRQQWKKFSKTCENSVRERTPRNFDELENIIIKSLRKEIGQITIRKPRKCESKETKKKREVRKEKEKLYQEACSNKPPDFEAIREEYYQAQKDLREQIEKDDVEQPTK